MEDILDVFFEGVQEQIEILNETEDVEKIRQAAPTVQISILAILTTVLITATQQLVEIKESLQRAEDKELKE